MCRCSKIYNNNYNYNSLFDTSIHNHNFSFCYAAYNILVTDKFYSLDSNKQLVLTRCCFIQFCFNRQLCSVLLQSNTFSLTNVPKLESSRSRLLEKFVANVCICVLSCMSFSYAHCCCLDVRYISVYVFVHIHSC